MLLLTFTVGVNRYAVDVTHVVEVVPRVELRKISHAPPSLAGLLDYRGKIVPVIDLGSLLELAPSRDCLSTRIILIDDSPNDLCRREPDRNDVHEVAGSGRADSRQDLYILGLIAEHVTDLTDTQPEQIVPAPVYLPDTCYLGGIVHTDGGLIQLIVANKVREASLHIPHLRQSEGLNSISGT